MLFPCFSGPWRPDGGLWSRVQTCPGPRESQCMRGFAPAWLATSPGQPGGAPSPGSCLNRGAARLRHGPTHPKQATTLAPSPLCAAAWTCRPCGARTPSSRVRLGRGDGSCWAAALRPPCLPPPPPPRRASPSHPRSSLSCALPQAASAPLQASRRGRERSRCRCWPSPSWESRWTRAAMWVGCVGGGCGAGAQFRRRPSALFQPCWLILKSERRGLPLVCRSLTGAAAR